jgi:putative SOS response-associated peptidase YedK
MFFDFFQNRLSRVQIPTSSFFEKERTAQKLVYSWIYSKNVVAFEKGFQKIVEFAHLWVLRKNKHNYWSELRGKSIITIKNREKNGKFALSQHGISRIKLPN